jgi:hypothetical protein
MTDTYQATRDAYLETEPRATLQAAVHCKVCTDAMPSAEE